MIDVDPVIHDELERLAPEADECLPDWQDAIRRAQRRVPVNEQRRSWARPVAAEDAPGGSSGAVAAKTEISPSRASAALGQPALWLGEEWRGYRLVETNRAELSIGYGPRSEREPTRTIGVEFEYAKITAAGSVDRDSTFTLRETTICTIFWGGQCGPRMPPPGTMLTGVPPGALIRTEDLYVSVWDLLGRLEAPALELARALRPVPNG